MTKPAGYTKGPWRRVGPGALYSVHGKMVFGATLNEHDDPVIDIKRADDRLISAAPDLYEALRDMMECDEQGEALAVVSRARAALAKAEGR